jgi:hypothetical protein
VSRILAAQWKREAICAACRVKKSASVLSACIVFGVAPGEPIFHYGKCPGRPRTAVDIEKLVVRLAEENRDWGYRRIQGALSNLGHEIARSTIAEILKRHGIEPAPERSRKMTWKEFLVSAGINRLGVANERVVQRRSSEPLWPRAM